MLHGNTASTEGHGHYCGCLDPGTAKKRREWKEGGGERMQRKGRGKEKGNSWYLLKGAENLHPHKNLHSDVQNSFIHNCQYLEAAKISFSK